MSKKKSLLAVRQARKGYGFIAFWLVGLVLLFAIPIIQSMIYSFCKVEIDVGNIKTTFVGFDNYNKFLFEDPDFLPAFFTTIANVIVQTPMILFFSLFMALLLNRQFKGRGLFRAIFFLPIVVASGVVLDIFQSDSYSEMLTSGARSSMMFETTGLTELFSGLNLNSSIVETIVNYVNDIFNLTWRSGIQMLIFLAALQSVPTQLYEVAKVEGATGWETFWKITFPMISSMILVNTTYTLVDLFGDYSNEILQIISAATESIKVGASSAMSWFYFLAVFIVIIVTYFLINRKVVWIG